MMKLNNLLQCMCAMTLRIHDVKEQKDIFKGHIREIRSTGFKKIMKSIQFLEEMTQKT